MDEAPGHYEHYHSDHAVDYYEKVSELLEELRENRRGPTDLISRLKGFLSGLKTLWVEGPRPTGVFVLVGFQVKNVTDSVLHVGDADFSVQDENGRSYTVSNAAAQASANFARQMLGEREIARKQEAIRRSRDAAGHHMSDWWALMVQHRERFDEPPAATWVPIFSDQGFEIQFKELALRPGSEVAIRAVFDIPRKGHERRLKIRFRDGPLVPIDTK